MTSSQLGLQHDSVKAVSIPMKAVSIPMAAKAALVLAVTAIMFRTGLLGNPLGGLDEQFYLMVGDRMWHGDLPYVDIWDRKPFGLFLIFAAIRMLPGDGVVAAQVVASLSALATAIGIMYLARRTVAWVPATMAGIFYIAGLNELGGETWQTPVFYNLAIVMAAILTLRAVSEGDRRAMQAAMLLAGFAIQIKTSAIFQGAFFGLWLAGAEWHRTRDGQATLFLIGRMILTGAVPTLTVMTFYAAIGEFSAWWQANVLSILSKAPASATAIDENLWSSLILVSPVLLLAIFGFWAKTRRFTEWRPDVFFFAGWIVLAIVDFGALGGYYVHYTLPLLLAACPVISHGFAVRRVGWGVFALFIAWPLVHATWHNPRIRTRDVEIASEVMARMPASVRQQCIFVYEGPVAYHRMADACRVTRFPFSAHISSRREGPSLGVDPVRELETIMTRRQPAVVLTVEHLRWPDRNLDMERRLAVYLSHDYQLRARVRHRFYSATEKLLIWQRRDLPDHRKL